MYDSINTEHIVSSTEIDKLCNQVAKLENQIKLLVENKTSNTNGSMTFDIKALADNLNLQEINEIKTKTETYISDIFCYVNNFGDISNRIGVVRTISEQDIREWIDSLETIIVNYKWSNYISIDIVFSSLKNKYAAYVNESILYDNVLNFWNICNLVRYKFSEDEYNNFIISITNILVTNYGYQPYISPNNSTELDDLPF